MGTYETTASAASDSYLDMSAKNTNFDASANGLVVYAVSTGSTVRKPILSGLLPQKPLGADDVIAIFCTLTYRKRAGPSWGTRTLSGYKITVPWSEASTTWNKYATGASWTHAGGDYGVRLGTSDAITGSYGASYTIDITTAGYDWGSRANVLLFDSDLFSSSDVGANFFAMDGGAGVSPSTYAYLPHFTMQFFDNPPTAINDLRAEPDISLSEASYTFRQHATLKWTASDANDFFRYRIRYGINRSLAANHTQKAFVNSRGSTSYLDATDYTNGSTVYYSIYVEDQRNQSASTNANVSNILSWKKPRLVSFTLSPGSPVDVLAQVTCSAIPSDTTNETKALVYWGDGSKSISETFNSGGTAIQAYHRFTKATAASVVRVQIEDLNGFRSNFGGQSLGRTIVSPGPIARIVASPSRQRTAGTFSFGFGPSSGDRLDANYMFIDIETTALRDGVATRYRMRASFAAGDFYAQLWRLEGAEYRCIYSDLFTASSTAGNTARTINWNVRRGDFVGIQSVAGSSLNITGGHSSLLIQILSTAMVQGTRFPRYRLSANPNAGFRADYVYTNPVHFSAKDSFARGSNRFINRFRWDTDYNGTFGADFNTGATTSFYYAWTTATTQFVAVRAVDNTHASSIDIAGVVIETEATFRFPDDLRDGVNAQIRDSRSRAYTQSYALSKDYGTLDLGALGPRSLALSGTAYSKATSSTSYIDIDRVLGVFQQRKRCYVHLPGKSTSSAVQGYVVDAPNIYSTDDPDAAGWDLTIVVAT